MDAHCCCVWVTCAAVEASTRPSSLLGVIRSRFVTERIVDQKESNQALLFISLLYLSFFCFLFLLLPARLLFGWNTPEESSLLSESNKKFFVFHDWGVSVYEPQNCRLLHMIQSTDIMPGTQVSTLYRLVL